MLEPEGEEVKLLEMADDDTEVDAEEDEEEVEDMESDNELDKILAEASAEEDNEEEGMTMDDEFSELDKEVRDVREAMEDKEREEFVADEEDVGEEDGNGMDDESLDVAEAAGEARATKAWIERSSTRQALASSGGFLRRGVATSSSAGCAQPGQLVFLHVMKTGGIAVDDFLVCEGKAQGWPIFRHDGQRHTVGNNDCAPAVCTLHGNLGVASAQANCGPAFAGAKAFTVLREPVERTWSFYNYLKNDKKYLPYQRLSFTDVMASLGQKDLNEGLVSKARCSFCHVQFSNTMVLYNFAGPKTRAAFGFCWGRLRGDLAHQRCAPTEEQLQTALAEAKEVLAGIHAVYFMEDLPKFDQLFRSDVTMSPSFRNREGKLFKKKTGGECKIGVKNKASYDAKRPSKDQVKILEELNWADIELYKFAQTLRSD